MNLRGRYEAFVLLLLSAFFLLAAAGCAKPPEPTEPKTTVEAPEPTYPATVVLHGDVDFSADEREKVLLAAEVWLVQTDTLARISVIWDADFRNESWLKDHAGDHLLGRFTSDDRLVREADDESEGKLLGRVAPSGGIHNPWGKPVRMLLVADRLTEKDSWLATTVHELGHVLGVPHVQAVQGVMFPYYIAHKHSCLKKPDLVAFCSVNECGAKKMHPCE